ncbi:hypothetical protein BT69DRAFT_1315116 [Atractiella rhizophila]|nr:hypothetical protein BT69DRAFT_1315116 [Atractiella rhizophila]
MAQNLMSLWSGRKLEAGNWKSWYEEFIRLVVGSGFGEVVLEEGSGGTPKPELPTFAIGGLKENATSFTSKMTTYQKWISNDAAANTILKALVTESDWDSMAKLGTCRERINVLKTQYGALRKQSEIFDLLNFVNMRQVAGEDQKEWWNKWRTKKRAVSNARSEDKVPNSFFLDLLKAQSIPPWTGLMEKVENDPKWARDYTSPTLRDKKFESMLDEILDFCIKQWDMDLKRIEMGQPPSNGTYLDYPTHEPSSAYSVQSPRTPTANRTHNFIPGTPTRRGSTTMTPPQRVFRPKSQQLMPTLRPYRNVPLSSERMIYALPLRNGGNPTRVDQLQEIPGRVWNGGFTAGGKLMLNGRCHVCFQEGHRGETCRLKGADVNTRMRARAAEVGRYYTGITQWNVSGLAVSRLNTTADDDGTKNIVGAVNVHIDDGRADGTGDGSVVFGPNDLAWVPAYVQEAFEQRGRHLPDNPAALSTFPIYVPGYGKDNPLPPEHPAFNQECRYSSEGIEYEEYDRDVMGGALGVQNWEMPSGMDGVWCVWNGAFAGKARDDGPILDSKFPVIDWHEDILPPRTALATLKMIHDTGATYHMVSSFNLLHNVREIEEPVVLRGVFDSSGTTKIVGEIHAVMENTDGTRFIVVFEDVLYLPQLGINLISAMQLMRNGMRFTNDRETIYYGIDDGRSIGFAVIGEKNVAVKASYIPSHTTFDAHLNCIPCMNDWDI